MVILMAPTSGESAPADLFQLSSQSIKPASTIGEEFIFDGGGCNGKNRSPDLSWSGAPAGTKSFALTVFDPDAPTGSGWWHWLVVNIASTVTSLAGGAGSADGQSLPSGAVQTRNDYGSVGYGGPCPPPGDKPHRYVFTLHALKVPRIDVEPQFSGAMVGFMINQNVIAKTQLIAYYAR